MAKYYVNKNAQTNGDHEVHKDGCEWMPDSSNKQYIGDYASCQPAVREAKKYFLKANGCFYCSRECHTQ